MVWVWSSWMWELLWTEKVSPSFMTHSFIHSSIYSLFFHLRWSKPFQRRATAFSFYLYFMSVYTLIIVWIFTLGTSSYLSSIEKTMVGSMTLFSLPPLFNFFLRTHYCLRLLSGYPSNTTVRTCDPSLVDHSISLSPDTLIELGKDKCVPTGRDYQNPQDTFSWATGK